MTELDMRPIPALRQSFDFFGMRVPLAAGLLAGLTLAASVLTAVGLPLGEWGALEPGRVWEGEVWRLATWVFFEMYPLTLVFACLMFIWIGRDLVAAWTPERFLLLCLAVVAVTGAVTCLIARFWLTGLRPFAGAWPLVDALIIAWAVLYPHRQILVGFVLPLAGRPLIYITVGLTLLWALFDGFMNYIPHFVAQGLALVYMYPMSLKRLWLRVKLASVEREYRRRTSHLRPVDRGGRDSSRWLH